ncbi:MAG: DUF2283 domain-containing protein [Candidatus Woesearchaeota archaeon]|nr:DUF2283 domain-containing protein [Candidatus Woesearchaeota archaeon]
MAKHDTSKKIVSYDSENDILLVHKGFAADEKFKGNLDIGGVVLDMSTKKRVRGIEVLNATNFFQGLVAADVLLHLTDADFRAVMEPQRIALTVTFYIQQEAIPARIAVPLATPDTTY